MKNLVVVNYMDGKVVRGHTLDFGPEKELFHLVDEDGRLGLVFIRDLKAVFFVKNLEGRMENGCSNSASKPKLGRKITVEFRDGEQIVGTTFDHQVTKDRFFIFPADEDDNNERILINRLATKYISLEDVATEDDEIARKRLEIKMYKLIYGAACELANLRNGDVKRKSKSIGLDLINQLNGPASEYREKLDDAAWRKFRESKLMEVRMATSDRVYDQMRELIDKCA
jgi:Family of unknown function (DUF6982)